MRRLSTLVAVTSVLVALAACDDGSDAPSNEASEPSQAEASCSEDSPLTVDEQGFSELTESSDENLKVISFAAVISNGSDSQSVAHNGTVQVTFLDASGEEIPSDEQTGAESTQSFDLTALAPGGSRAISGQALLTEVPDSIDVSGTGSCTQDGDVGTGDVTVTDSTVSVDDDELTAQTTVNSTFDKEVQGFPVFVFYGTDSQIIGGGPYQGVSGQSQVLSIPAGDSAQDVTVDVDGFLPEGADVDATRVYIQPVPS